MRIEIMKPLHIGLAIIGFLVNPGSVVAEEKTVTLNVKSMTCSLCPVTVRKALEQDDGVKEAAVSF
jgi:periplasmic mercuric ion binding protein